MHQNDTRRGKNQSSDQEASDERIREAAKPYEPGYDKTVADTFPASDPPARPSSIGAPDAGEKVSRT